jgi:hypothetical protein
MAIGAIMKKHLIYATIVGFFGMTIMFLQITVLQELVNRFLPPILSLFILNLAVGLITSVITLKLSTGLIKWAIMARVTQTVWLSAVIANFPLLIMTGYYVLLRNQYSGVLFRDSADIAFSIFLFTIKINLVLGLVLGIILSINTNLSVKKQYSSGI